MEKLSRKGATRTLQATCRRTAHYDGWSRSPLPTNYLFAAGAFTSRGARTTGYPGIVRLAESTAFDTLRPLYATVRDSTATSPSGNRGFGAPYCYPLNHEIVDEMSLEETRRAQRFIPLVQFRADKPAS